MKEKGGISQVGNHPFGRSGAVTVVIRQQPKTLIQSPALFAGLDQRHIKRRQPPANVQQRFSQGAAIGEFLEYPLDGLAVGTGGRMALELLQRGDEPQPGGGELIELIVKLGALGELSGCDNH